MLFQDFILHALAKLTKQIQDNLSIYVCTTLSTTMCIQSTCIFFKKNVNVSREKKIRGLRRHYSSTLNFFSQLL